LRERRRHAFRLERHVGDEDVVVLQSIGGIVEAIEDVDRGDRAALAEVGLPPRLRVLCGVRDGALHAVRAVRVAVDREAGQPPFVIERRLIRAVSRAAGVVDLHA
jgi:hypothetical protein